MEPASRLRLLTDLMLGCCHFVGTLPLSLRCGNLKRASWSISPQGSWHTMPLLRTKNCFKKFGPPPRERPGPPAPAVSSWRPRPPGGRGSTPGPAWKPQGPGLHKQLSCFSKGCGTAFGLRRGLERFSCRMVSRRAVETCGMRVWGLDDQAPGMQGRDRRHRTLETPVWQSPAIGERQKASNVLLSIVVDDVQYCMICSKGTLRSMVIQLTNRIHIHTYICICMYTYIYIYAFQHIYVYIYTHNIYLFIHLCIYIYRCVKRLGCAVLASTEGSPVLGPPEMHVYSIQHATEEP